MTELARKLRVIDYFTLGWGTMVGVGWLVLMDDWLQRGGPLGGILGFAIGGSLLLPIGYVYGKLVLAMPDAAGEVAYTAKVFPRPVSFATGWMMLLAYFIVCPWEAVAVGRIAAYMFPVLDSLELYRVAGRPVFLPRLVGWPGAYGPAHRLELSRHPAERNFPELDFLRNARSLRGIRRGGNEQRLARELFAAVLACAILIRVASYADRALFHDGI